VAQNYSEDMNTAPNGGDMGFIPQASLEKASPDLRRLVDSLAPGVASQPIQTPDGYRILKVITREPAGQRDQTTTRAAEHSRNSGEPEDPITCARFGSDAEPIQIQNYMAPIVDNTAKEVGGDRGAVGFCPLHVNGGTCSSRSSCDHFLKASNLVPVETSRGFQLRMVSKSA
jgi:hypothetical protein